MRDTNLLLTEINNMKVVTKWTSVTEYFMMDDKVETIWFSNKVIFYFFTTHLSRILKTRHIAYFTSRNALNMIINQ